MMFMPSCRELALKLAQGEFDSLPWPKRLLMRIHLAMCGVCRRFERQIGILGEAYRHRRDRQPDAGRLSALKKRLLEDLG